MSEVHFWKVIEKRQNDSELGFLAKYPSKVIGGGGGCDRGWLLGKF